MRSKFTKRFVAGFTLIEVLVAVVILAIGLLGLAGMQTLSLKNNQDAFLYTQATSLAYEMSDRIKVNADYWKAAVSGGAIPTAPSATCTTGCNSSGATCTPVQMAASDYCYWYKKVTSILGSSATVNIEKQKAYLSCPGNTGTLCLQMAWIIGNQSSSSSNTKQSFQLEVRP